jgi:hypothetical protein
MDASFGPKLYYRHSGEFSAGGLVIALLAGLAVGLPCAWLYAWLIHWNPFIYIDIVASLGFGGIVGLAVESSLVSHKCRNVPLTALVAFVAILISYYASWAVWLHALRGQPTLTLLLHPAAMWQVILDVNEKGAWTLRGSVVNGIPLWIAWILEAGFIVGAAVVLALQAMQQATYCESCDRFAKITPGVCYAGAGQAPPITDKAAFKSYQKGLKQQGAELKRHLENKDLAFLEQLGAVQLDAIAWYQLDLVSCPQCNMTNTLRVVQLANKIEGKKIRNETAQTEVLRQLLLSSTEAESLRKLGQQLSPLLPRLVQERARQAQKAAAAAQS